MGGKNRMKRFKIALMAVLTVCAAALVFSGCGNTGTFRLPAVPTIPPKETVASMSEPTYIPKVTPAPAEAAETAETEGPEAAPEPTPEPQPEQTAAPVDPDMPVLTITDETLPQDMEQLNVSDLRGVISVDKGQIEAVYGSIVNSLGETVQYSEFFPEEPRFSLAGTVNAELSTIYLDVDTYTYIVEAVARNRGKSCSDTLIYHTFDVLPRSDGLFSGLTVSGDKVNFAGEAGDEYIARFTDDKSNDGRIWNFFAYQLKNPYGAAAVLANIRIESKCDPNRLQGDNSDDGAYSAQYVAKVDAGTVDRAGFIATSAGAGFGPGFGLCQWSGERKADLYDFMASRSVSVGDLESQCMYILRDLKHNYPKLLEMLTTATDVGTATLEFCNVYEQAPNRDGRTDKAREYLETFARNN